MDMSYAPITRTLKYDNKIYDTHNTPDTSPYDEYPNVNIINPPTYDELQVNISNTDRDSMQSSGYASVINDGICTTTDSPVKDLYFSPSNMERIQKMIRREIYNRSYGKFRLKVDQDTKDLTVAMMAVYKLYAKNLPTKIKRQVKRLNKETVQYIAPDMMTELKQKYSYIQHIKNPIQPIPDPINVNQAGRHQLQGVADYLNL